MEKLLEGLQVVELSIDELTPYEKNAKKHPKKQIDELAENIKTFGFNDPIGVWGDKNIIVEGHGRLEACKKLGMDKVPCIRLDHLTDEQRRAYTLAHNKSAEGSEWDYETLNAEIDDLPDFDFGSMGFEFEDEEEPVKKKNERLRTDNAYNLPFVDLSRCEGDYQMPAIEGENHVPDSLIGFNYALTSKDKSAGVHFYVDDYQMERCWNDPEKYINVLKDYDCVLTPDFSLYRDMPASMMIWNTFRSRLFGQMCQDAGLTVIPTVSWADEKSFAFCFDGLPEEATLSISTVGVMRYPEAVKIWKAGVDELIKRKKPKRLLVYGNPIDYDFGDIEIIYFKNSVTERMKESRKKGNG